MIAVALTSVCLASGVRPLAACDEHSSRIPSAFALPCLFTMREWSF